MRMITDEKRREVAAELRRLTDGCHNSGVLDSDVLDVLGVSYTDIPNCSDAYDVEMLADLIDRPTCRIVHDENRDCDVCTNCLTSFELAEFDYADANVFEGYSYCPKCGAEVRR